MFTFIFKYSRKNNTYTNESEIKRLKVQIVIFTIATVTLQAKLFLHHYSLKNTKTMRYLAGIYEIFIYICQLMRSLSD